MTKQRDIYRNRDSGQLFEVWAEVAYCGDLLEGEDKFLVVYSQLEAEAPQFARECQDFQREFIRDDRHQLYKFYGVNTLETLVEAQAKHIERLQAQLPTNVSPAYARVREG